MKTSKCTNNQISMIGRILMTTLAVCCDTNLVYVSLEIKYTYRYHISHMFKLSPASG